MYILSSDFVVVFLFSGGKISKYLKKKEKQYIFASPKQFWTENESAST